MSGYKSKKSTQHYASFYDAKVSADMRDLIQYYETRGICNKLDSVSFSISERGFERIVFA